MRPIFNQALNFKMAALVLFISTASQLFCTTACQTSASRMLFAFSRDRAVPGRCLVGPANRVRPNAVMITAGIAALLTLPALVEVDINGAPVPIAFFAVVSIGVVGLYLCFAVPIYYRWKAGDSERWAVGTCAATIAGWRRWRWRRSSSPRSWRCSDLARRRAVGSSFSGSS